MPRIEARLEGDERAHRRCGALANRQTDALGPIGETRGLHGSDAHHDAVAALTLLVPPRNPRR